MKFFLALALALALPVAAQVHVVYSPIQIGRSQAVFGPGHTVGFWRVSLDNRGSAERTVSWELIVSYAPAVPWYPNQLGQDLASRQAQQSRKAKLGRVWDASAPTAGSVAGAIGLALKSPNAQYAGLGLTAVSALVNLLRTGAPDPRPYFDKMLPARVKLAPGEGATFYAASGLVDKVHILTEDIPAPQ